MNLKLDGETERYAKEKGIYPAYHMNKKNWVSVELNGDVAYDFLFKLVSISFSPFISMSGFCKSRPDSGLLLINRYSFHKYHFHKTPPNL